MVPLLIRGQGSVQVRAVYRVVLSTCCQRLCRWLDGNLETMRAAGDT